jgi:hypothetical protein
MNPNDGAQPSITDADIDRLVSQIQADETSNVSVGQGELSLSDLSGFTEEELQSFLEEKAGLTAASGAQQSIAGLAVTFAVHC